MDIEDELEEFKLSCEDLRIFSHRIKYQKKYNEFINIIIDRTKFLEEYYSEIHINQRLYHYFLNKLEIESCEFCHEQGKRLLNVSHFNLKNNIIYREYCEQSECLKHYQENKSMTKWGLKSPNSHPDVIQKCKQTCLENFGVEHQLKSPKIQEKIKQTNLKKYGVKNPTQNKEIRSKIEQTCLQRYGTKSPAENVDILKKMQDTNFKKYGYRELLKSPEIREKIKQTNLEKYGYENSTQNKEISDKIRKTKLGNLIDRYEKIGYTYISNEGLDQIILRCDKCGKTFEQSQSFLSQRFYFNFELCTNCNPRKVSGTSAGEQSLINFIQDLKDFNLDLKDRTLLKDREIDILLPELKIGFEFNGIYWHSTIYKESDYHQQKKLKGLASGINIINIWEDDWNSKRTIIESRIKNILGVTKNKVYARQTKIIDLNSKDMKEFLEQNHIQGSINAKWKYGLLKDDNLISVMTFGNRYGKIEMLRFANKLDFNVVGGFSKLFKHFLKETGFNEIISYADLDWTDLNDNVYLKNGFELDGVTKPGYFWSLRDKREHRQKFQKHKLIEQGFDENLTEDQIMYKQGALKIYNSGNGRFIYKI